MFLTVNMPDFEKIQQLITNIVFFYVPRLHLNTSKFCELPRSEKLAVYDKLFDIKRKNHCARLSKRCECLLAYRAGKWDRITSGPRAIG